FVSVAGIPTISPLPRLLSRHRFLPCFFPNKTCQRRDAQAYFAGFDFDLMPKFDSELLAKAKSLGFSDQQLAHLTGQTEDAVRAQRKKFGMVPSFRLVDTCAAEFEAYTPYYYSTYDRGDDEVRCSDKRKFMSLRGGRNRVGQVRQL